MASICAIDTNIAIAANFGFANGPMAKLLEVAEDQSIKIIVTDIVRREIGRNLNKAIAESRAAAESFRKKARVLRQSSGPDILSLCDDAAVVTACNSVQTAFEAFLRSPCVIQIPTNETRTAEVLERYFNGEPPFSGSGNKSEFPDAFFATTIAAYSEKTGSSITIISNDGGVQKYCDVHARLNTKSSLNEYFESVLLGAHEEVLSIRKSVVAKLKEIESIVMQSGGELGAEADVEAESSGDASVESVELSGIEMFPRSIRVVGLDENSVYVNAEAMFEAQLVIQVENEYPDGSYSSSEVHLEDYSTVPVRFEISRKTLLDSGSIKMIDCVVNDNAAIYFFTTVDTDEY